jgi:predicted ArsR family transcriptional regulator
MTIVLTKRQITILTELGQSGPLTRKQLTNNTGIPRTTLYDNLKKLLEWDEVEKIPYHEGNRGRPIIFWRLKQ